MSPKTSAHVPAVLLPFRVPQVLQIGIERVAVRLQVLHQLRGDRGGEGLVRGVGVVARVAENADLVFDLHHQNGVVARVDFFDVLHERGKGAGVGCLSGRRLRTQDLDGVAALDDARKAARILLDPDGRIARQAVLPRGQPEEDNALVLVPRLIDEAVDEREVVGAFFGLDQLPTQRRDHGVEAHGCEFGPDRLHVFQVRRGRVVQLAGEHQEWLAVHDQLGGGAAFFEMRRCGGLRGKRGGFKAEEQQKDWQRAKWVSHNDREFSTEGIAVHRDAGLPPFRQGKSEDGARRCNALALAHYAGPNS